MTELRHYQEASVNSVIAVWEAGAEATLIDLPTGTGKSVVLSEICRYAMQWPGTKVVVVTHIRELVEQNTLELLRLWPQAPVGINSAGLGRRDTKADIIFCSVQSVYSQAYKFDRVDILVIDEAHLIPRNSQTMYGKFIADLRIVNPEIRIVGLTATPFRLDSGRLDEGDDRLFTSTAYSYPIRQAIEEGFLAPLTSKHTRTQLDLSNVGTLGGEFKANELEAAVDVQAITDAAVDETIAQGQDRKSWLFFCSGVNHALHVRDAVRARGYSCETIHAKTPKDERRTIIRDFKAGKIRALASMNVLTTGFNAPAVDLIALLRPTKSAGLYIQMAGRGTRLSPGKTDCLVLDFAGNIERFGPIDAIQPKKPGKGEGEAPVKACPDCDTYVPAGVRVCPCCGHEFPAPQPKVQARATTLAIMSDGKPEWLDVREIFFNRHRKEGSPDSMKVTYQTGRYAEHSEWICFEHPGFAGDKAKGWWNKAGGRSPAPKTVTEALDRQYELNLPAEILVRQEGKFTRVLQMRGAFNPKLYAAF